MLCFNKGSSGLFAWLGFRMQPLHCTMPRKFRLLNELEYYYVYTVRWGFKMHEMQECLELHIHTSDWNQEWKRDIQTPFPNLLMTTRHVNFLQKCESNAREIWWIHNTARGHNCTQATRTSRTTERFVVQVARFRRQLNGDRKWRSSTILCESTHLSQTKSAACVISASWDSIALWLTCVLCQWNWIL